MPSIDELLGLSVEELEALTDEQLLERYASIFQLEPAAPPETDDKETGEEDESSGVATTKTRRQAKKSESKAKIADLKAKLMEASKKGLTADQAFEEDFKDL